MCARRCAHTFDQWEGRFLPCAWPLNPEPQQQLSMLEGSVWHGPDFGCVYVIILSVLFHCCTKVLL